jgi:hypothetical protein
LDKSNPLTNILEFKCQGGTVTYGSTRKKFTGPLIPKSALVGAARGQYVTVEAKGKNKKTGEILKMPRASIKIE